MRQRVKIVIKEEIVRELYAIAGEDAVQIAEPMKNHTTFRVGGPADYFVAPHTEEEIRKIVALCEEKEIPWFVTGNGSNLVVSDEGYHGVILSVYKNFQGIEVEGNRIRAKAGSMLVSISQAAREAGLSGMEFASGIPGTLGGGVRMNAGAYGGEMKDVLEFVTVLTGEGKIIELGRNELELGYRTSVIAKKGYIVLGAVLKLERGDGEKIKTYMDELKEKRVTKQPLEYPSAGSTFKRPEGYFAGKLIQDSGLKGFTVGGAQVSEKHSGFVINKGNATAADVMELIRQVTAKVKEDTGVTMEPEVKQIGEF
jgi:UDP-N-acetylmuramate dehydrogenase